MRLAAVRTRHHLAGSRARRLSDCGGRCAIPMERKLVVVPDDRRGDGDGVRDLGMALSGRGVAPPALHRVRHQVTADTGYVGEHSDCREGRRPGAKRPSPLPSAPRTQKKPKLLRRYLDGVGTPGWVSDGASTTTQPVAGVQAVLASQFSNTSGLSSGGAPGGGSTIGCVGTPGTPPLGGM